MIGQLLVIFKVASGLTVLCSGVVAACFEGATRHPFQAPHEPGLNVSGAGRGCNRLTGRFDVLELTFDGVGALRSLAIDFEQHCEGTAPALFGVVQVRQPLDLGKNKAPGRLGPGGFPLGHTAWSRRSPTVGLLRVYATETGRTTKTPKTASQRQKTGVKQQIDRQPYRSTSSITGMSKDSLYGRVRDAWPCTALNPRME